MRRFLLVLVIALLVAAVVQIIVRLSAPHAPHLVPILAGNASFALVVGGILALNRKVQVTGWRVLAVVILFMALNLACLWVAVANDSMLSLLLLFPILTIGYYPPVPDPGAMWLWALSLPVPIVVGVAIGVAWRRLRPAT
jgi:hypothetical protein